MLKFSSNFYLKYRYLFLAKKDILKPSKNRAINQTKEGIHMEMNKNIEKWYELHTDEVNALSDDIWAHPEVGYAGALRRQSHRCVYAQIRV